MESLLIGQLARQAGVGVETVRFYEREGLLEKPARRHSGYRQYGENSVAQVRFIKRAQQLGFTLREIKSLLALRHDPDATKADVREQALAKIADIDARIRDLERIKDALLPLADACDGHGPLADCPIIHAMDEPINE